MWYIQVYMNDLKRIRAKFFENEGGKMPVREWLLELSGQDRKIIRRRYCDCGVWMAGWNASLPLHQGAKGHLGN